MDDQNDDFNDLMFEINDHREQQAIPSISNDSNIGSSLSNFGIDIDNAEQNEQYILANQNLNAVIQGVGVEDRFVRNLEDDSCLATSISKTRDSDFIPFIIEHKREKTDSSLNSQSLLNECDLDIEPVESSVTAKNNEELENLSDKLEEVELSSFDLAIEKGYPDQAQIYYDYIFSEGLKLKSKFVKSEDELLGKENFTEPKEQVIERDFSQLWDGYVSKEFLQQMNFMLKKDFRDYLENIENNQHKKILQRLKFKRNLNEIEKQIEKKINTKEKRCNLKLRGETIKLIKDFLLRLDALENYYKEIVEQAKNKSQNGRVIKQETTDTEDFNEEDNAIGISQPSCSKYH